MPRVPIAQQKELRLQCEWGTCTEILNTSQKLTNHLMGHAEEFIAGKLSVEECLATLDPCNTDEFQCQWVDCGYLTSEGSAALLRHLLFHGYHTRIKFAGNVERERCKVEQCQLEAHSRNIIPEVPSSFVCSWEDCSFITNNPDYFYCHVEMHSQMSQDLDGLFHCKWTECQVKTKDKYKLRDHLRSHSQEKRFGCIQCGGLFSNRTKYFDHIHRQGILDEPNYQCSHCSKVFASERLLRDHMRHHVNHYKCPFCDMTCPVPSVLKKHIQWRHSTERPFECELCDHRAKTRTDMRRHMESHNADDAYQCDVEDCLLTFKSLSSLRVHFRKEHSDMEDQRYMCHVCQRKFARGFTLTTHLKNKHRFKWPSGHVRFRYKEHEDGYWRLQTVRYESIELTQQILQLDNAPPQQSLPAIVEQGEGKEADVVKAKTGRRSKKKSSLENNPPLRCNQASGNISPEYVQYAEDDPGDLIVVEDDPGALTVVEAEDANSKEQHTSLQTYEPLGHDTTPKRNKPKRARRKSPSVTRSDNLKSPTVDLSNRAVSIESGGRPLSRKRIRYDDPDGQTDAALKIHEEEEEICSSEASSTTSLEFNDNSSSSNLSSMGMFPIEQMQTLDNSPSKLSVGLHTPSPERRRMRYLPVEQLQSLSGNERSPPSSQNGKTRYFPIEQFQTLSGNESSPSPRKRMLLLSAEGPSNGVVNLTDDERMRMLFNRIEDDRMADAVEAMTSLGRGLGTPL